MQLYLKVSLEIKEGKKWVAPVEWYNVMTVRSLRFAICVNKQVPSGRRWCQQYELLPGSSGLSVCLRSVPPAPWSDGSALLHVLRSVCTGSVPLHIPDYTHKYTHARYTKWHVKCPVTSPSHCCISTCMQLFFPPLILSTCLLIFTSKAHCVRLSSI